MPMTVCYEPDKDIIMTHHGDEAWGIIGEARTVTDAEGRTWRVFEFNSPFYSPPRRMLLFDSGDGATIHRVSDYPRDWHFLDDGALLALMKR